MTSFTDWVCESETRFIVAALLVLIGAVYSILAIVNRMEFPASVAKIEQLREDSKKVSGHSNEDIIGKIADANMAIAKAQAYNKLWYADIVIPDAWDDIPFIEIPEEENK